MLKISIIIRFADLARYDILALRISKARLFMTSFSTNYIAQLLKLIWKWLVYLNLEEMTLLKIWTFHLKHQQLDFLGSTSKKIGLLIQILLSNSEQANIEFSRSIFIKARLMAIRYWLSEMIITNLLWLGLFVPICLPITNSIECFKVFF